LQNLLKGKKEVIEVEDLTGKIPHSRYGGACKSFYLNKNKVKIYALERFESYGEENYYNDIFQFKEDFDVDSVNNFIKQYDLAKSNSKGVVKTEKADKEARKII
jgi:hypothetical protein